MISKMLMATVPAGCAGAVIQFGITLRPIAPSRVDPEHHALRRSLKKSTLCYGLTRPMTLRSRASARLRVSQPEAIRQIKEYAVRRQNPGRAVCRWRAYTEGAVRQGGIESVWERMVAGRRWAARRQI
jgi:hypothetical protein